MTAPATRIVHRMTGRTRLRTRGMRGNVEYFAQIRGTLLEMSGVHAVQVNPRTESILIEHDGPPEPLLHEAETRGYLQLETAAQNRESYLARLGRALQESDRNLQQATTGRVDLDTVTFFGLLAGGVYQVANGHGLPAGVTLLRYAVELVTDAAGAARAAVRPGDGNGRGHELSVRGAAQTGGSA
ncbi:MAG TPA: hypothetical protein VG963_05205 [Polyangiaceae bacterium]|nr:hypothetical protein [Polyangiaceae bacterium]